MEENDWIFDKKVVVESGDSETIKIRSNNFIKKA